MKEREYYELFGKGFNLAAYAGIPEGFRDARAGIEDINDYFALESSDKRFIIYGEVIEDEAIRDENGEIELKGIRIEGAIITAEANNFSRDGRKVLRSIGFVARKTRNPIFSIPFKVFNIGDLEEVEKEIKRLVGRTVEIYEEVKTKENER
jgi:hypothetical protein